MPRLGGTPILFVSDDTERKTGKDAQQNNIRVGKAVADVIRTTLGPKGMDKMLVDEIGDIIVTNDGATILNEMDINHPAGKMLVEVAQTQDTETGDGTTTAVIVAGELLSEAEDLLDQDIHPTLIIKGYKIAQEKAIEYLKGASKEISIEDDEILRNVCATSMRSKGTAIEREDMLAKIIVKAVKQIADKTNGQYKINKDNVKIITKEGGNLEDSNMVDGIVVDKERVHSSMPEKHENPKIALLNAPIEVKETETDAEIQITNPDQLESFLEQEENMLKDIVNKIKDSNVDVIFCQKGIDDMAQHHLAKAGITAVRRVKKSDMKKLARATGASIVSSIEDLSDADLGSSDVVEERRIGDSEMTFVEGCREAKAVTLLVRGGTEHVVEEAERAVVDGIGALTCAIETGEVVTGGGAIETEIAMKLKEYAGKVGGREQLAIEGFATALESIPRTLSRSAGMDPIDTLVRLRSEHSSGKKHFGVNAIDSKVENMENLKVTDPAKVKKQAISSGSEAANTILRIDDIISSSGSGKDSGGGGGAPGGMPAGMGGGGMPPGMGGMM